MPRKPDYTKHQKQIQGKRLQSIMKEKGIRASEIVAYIEEHGEDADYTDRFPKYKRGEMAIPKHIIPLVADCLGIDADFFTDVNSFADSYFSNDYSYSNYINFKNCTNIMADESSFYNKYSAIFRLFGYYLRLYDEDNYEICEGDAFNPKYSIKATKEELFTIIENIKRMGFDYIHQYKKEGDADD